MRARSAARLLLAAALFAAGCNQILGIEKGILDTGDAAVPDGGVDGAGDTRHDGQDAIAVDGLPQQDATPNDAAAPECTGKCGETNCGACPTNTMIQIGDVTGYYVDATEVTNLAYNAYLATNPHPDQAGRCSWNVTFEPSGGIATGKDQHPVVGVDWCDAFGYCVWARKRLCGKIGASSLPVAEYNDQTKSQWFNACKRGAVGNYPYAGLYSPHACNGDDHGVGSTVGVATMSGCEGGTNGLFDMSGNVEEWEDSCSAETGAGDPCRVRGGSFTTGALGLQCDADVFRGRSALNPGVGFRCCRDP